MDLVESIDLEGVVVHFGVLISYVQFWFQSVPRVAFACLEEWFVAMKVGSHKMNITALRSSLLVAL